MNIPPDTGAPVEPNSPGGRLREARRRRGWTQTQLAEAAGVRQADITHYERGSNMRLEVAARLADALGVTLDWLARGEAKAKSAAEEAGF